MNFYRIWKFLLIMIGHDPVISITTHVENGFFENGNIGNSLSLLHMHDSRCSEGDKINDKQEKLDESIEAVFWGQK